LGVAVWSICTAAVGKHDLDSRPMDAAADRRLDLGGRTLGLT
jgi:hypothetical protein